MSLFAVFLEGVIYFSVTFPACKAITENGRRHHKYANCCQLTGFAGSALGSGIAAAGGIRGARPPLRAPSAAEPPPRLRAAPLRGARQRARRPGKGSFDSHEFPNSCRRSRSLARPFCVCLRVRARLWGLRRFSLSFAWGIRVLFVRPEGRRPFDAASLSSHGQDFRASVSSPERCSEARGGERTGSPPPPRRQFFTYPGKSGDARVRICSLKHTPRPSLF